METKQLTPDCLQVSDTYQSGYEQEYLLISDVHFDNPKCKRDLLYRHFDEAKKRNAKILSFGDFFCFMQGRYDKRSAKSDIRPEHNTNTYLDSVIEDTIDQLTPWAENFLLFGDGNHETAILKNLETDPTGRLVKGLNERGGMVYRGGYQGFAHRGVRPHARPMDNGAAAIPADSGWPGSGDTADSH